MHTEPYRATDTKLTWPLEHVQQDGLPRIRPNQPAEPIAQNIPNPASTCDDSGPNQPVIPMNANNALAFLPLGR